MHFSIPDTQELLDEAGNSFTAFNINVNGVFHCAVRYKQLHNFHEQIKKSFSSSLDLPPFPPKKILSLTSIQLEERRCLLERYIQIISQEPLISNSDIFNGFLLNAQQETQQAEPKPVTLDVCLMNGHKITCSITSTDQTDSVLESVASKIELGDEFVYYFGLFLVRKESNGDNSIVRKLQDFESPFISLKAALKDGVHRIVLRKCIWDPSIEDDLMDNRIAMNLLYVQAVNDIERGWVLASKEQHRQLAALQNKGSKKEYLRLARTLKFYGFIQFKACYTDYPQPDCRVVIYAGNRELVFRVQTANDQIKEGLFKVTRMRCWRITTTYPDSVNGSGDDHLSNAGQLELAFEYLIAKDTLKWIRITSEEAILMSMCLQGMVDELLMKKHGKRMKRPQDRNKKSAASTNFLKRDGASNIFGAETEDGSTAQKARESVKKIQDKFSAVSIKTSSGVGNLRGPSQNDAFEDAIGDDDL
ncbi:sorting nexin-17-like [Tubulanus polymorphus]|uniref:sorting nexin-17-like n=1 Tax=Tubulanus polymorphus TaxID=672921 RepID=UPI003DA38E4C